MAAHQNNLWESCCLGKLQMARELLLAGADPNTKAGRDNWTCLMQAIWRNHEEVVDLLLAQPGIEVNAKDNNRTALHYACHTGNIAILSKLLAVPGILVNERDVDGLTPIMSAISWISSRIELDIVRVMAAVEKVDLDVRDDSGLSLENLAYRCAKWDQC